MSFDKHACQVTSPVTTDPTKTLFQVLGAVLKCGLNFGCLVVLHRYLVSMGIDPSSNEIVVVGVELVSAPSFMREAKSKSIVL